MRHILTAALLLTMPAAAQIPSTLLHSIPALPTGVQQGTGFGRSIAMDGNYIVVGSPGDDYGGVDFGVVKVFNATTGALVYVLPNPGLAADGFGSAVAISDGQLLVGAPMNGTGATNSGRVYVYHLGSGTAPGATLNNPSPGANDQFGHAVAISGLFAVVGAWGDDTTFTNAGRAYIYTVNPGMSGVPLHVLDNPGTAAGDNFGYAVAIRGEHVAVGAYRDSTGAFEAGSVYLYHTAGGTPTLTVNHPSPASEDWFGFSLALSGTHLVVGAPIAGSPEAGKAYVFDLNSGTPATPVLTMSNPTPVLNEGFGYTVAMSGTRVLVGTPYDDYGAVDAGTAYVYDLSSGTPTVAVVTLNNPAPAVNDGFGEAIAISGSRVWVGDPSDDSVRVYDLSSGTPGTPLSLLSHPSPTATDLFGSSVAISGTRLVVGAYLDDTAASDGGRVYVYDLVSTSSTAAFVLQKPGAAADDSFGRAVAVSGSRVVVGVEGDDTGASNAGRVYVYDVSSGTPTVPVAILNNPAPAADDNFGRAVAISGTRVVVGAYLDDAGASNAGSAYVYDLTSGTPTVPIFTLPNPGPLANDNFGISVAIAGTTVVVAAYRDDTGATDSGSVYVYDLTSGTPTVPVVTLPNPSPASQDYFGYAVSISGTRIAVGAYQDDAGGSNVGRAYVFDLTSGTPTVPTATLPNPSPAAGDLFGYSVAISGARVVVGARDDDAGATDAGSAYVFDLGSGTPTVPVATLNNPGPAVSDYFSWSVALDAATIAIGAPRDDTVMTDKGYVYVFGPMDGDGDGLSDSWEITHFGTQYGHGPLDDFDHDGYKDLLEMALGLNPTISNAGGIPGVTQEGDYLTMTITKQPGVTYEVQTAGSLLTGQPDSFSAASTTVLINNATTLKVRDNVLSSGATARFIRVQVTAAP